MSKENGLEGQAKALPPDTRLRLILVRHGQSMANEAGVLQGQSQGKLTEKGIWQTELLGDHLQAFNIDRIISSDLYRVRQTVTLINKGLLLPVVETAAAREWNVGVLDGRPLTAFQEAVLVSGKTLFEFTPKGGERLLDVFHRASELIRNLVELKTGETVLLVSHGDFLRMVLGYMQGIALTEANRIRLDNTSYSIADLDKQGRWKIQTLNNTNHLPAA